MKIKYDKFSFEMTDKDSQNILNFIKYFSSLSDKEQFKVLVLLFGVPIVLSKAGMDVYKTIKEERRKDKLLDTQCEFELKTKAKKKELKEVFNMDQETRC